jgi:hypothetical protein
VLEELQNSAGCWANNATPLALLEISGLEIGGGILFFSRFSPSLLAVSEISGRSIEVNNFCILYYVKESTKQQWSLETELHIMLFFCITYPGIRHLCNMSS